MQPAGTLPPIMASAEAAEILGLLDRLCSEHGAALIFISHDREFVSSLATRIIELTPEGPRDFTGTYDEYLRTLPKTQNSKVA